MKTERGVIFIMRNWFSKHNHFLLLYVFFVMVTQIPFHFPSSDQAETVPVIMNKLDPSLFSNDWFVQASAENNYRIYFINLMSLLGGFIPLEYAFLLMTLIVTFFSFLAVYLMVFTVFRSQQTALMAVFLSMFLSGTFSLYGQRLIDHNLLPRSINVLFFVFALFFYLKRQYVAFFIALILSIPFHPMQAAYFVFCVLLSHVIISRRLMFPLFTIILCLSAVLVFFWPHIAGTRGLSQESKAEIFDALAVIRNPELLSIFHVNYSNIVFQAILVFLFFAVGSKKQYSLKERQLLWMIPGALILSVLQYVLVEVFNSYYGLFFFARSLSLMNFIFILFIADALSRNLKKYRVMVSSAFFAVLFSASALYAIARSRLRWLSSKVCIIVGVLLALMASQVYFCFISDCFDVSAAIKWWSSLLLVGSVYLILSKARLRNVISIILLLLFIGIQASIRPAAEIAPVLDTLRTTPRDVVVLAPPDLANEVLFLSEHSVVMNWDVIPSNPQGVREWRARLLDLTDNANFERGSRSAIIRDGYDSLSKEQLVSLAEKYNADLILTRKKIDCSSIIESVQYYLYNATCPYTVV